MSTRQTAILVGGLALVGALASFAFLRSAPDDEPAPTAARDTPRTYDEPPVLDTPDTPSSETAQHSEETGPEANGASVAASPSDAPEIGPAENAVPRREDPEGLSETEEAERRVEGLALIDSTLERLRGELEAQEAAGDETRATRTRARLQRMRGLRERRMSELGVMRGEAPE